MAEDDRIKSVAIIGAGASGELTLTPPTSILTHHIAGAITAAAFKAEKYFDRIQIFERRESAGGTWYP